MEEDEEHSIDLGRSPKRSSPVDLDRQTPGRLHRNSSNPTSHPQSNQNSTNNNSDPQHLAAALRQQLGAAFNFAGAQNLFGQFAAAAAANQAAALTALGTGASSLAANTNQNSTTAAIASQTTTTTATTGPINSNSSGNQDLLKQEQFLAALMAAAAAGNQQQQQVQEVHQPPVQTPLRPLSRPHPPPPPPAPQQQQQQTVAQQQATSATSNGSLQDQISQLTSRDGLSMLASNAMLISATNAPDAMALAQSAQALGVKGAFVILIL